MLTPALFDKTAENGDGDGCIGGELNRFSVTLLHVIWVDAKVGEHRCCSIGFDVSISESSFIYFGKSTF